MASSIEVKQQGSEAYQVPVDVTQYDPTAVLEQRRREASDIAAIRAGAREQALGQIAANQRHNGVITDDQFLPRAEAVALADAQSGRTS